MHLQKACCLICGRWRCFRSCTSNVKRQNTAWAVCGPAKVLFTRCSQADVHLLHRVEAGFSPPGLEVWRNTVTYCATQCRNLIHSCVTYPQVYLGQRQQYTCWLIMPGCSFYQPHFSQHLKLAPCSGCPQPYDQANSGSGSRLSPDRTSLLAQAALFHQCSITPPQHTL